MLTSMTRVLVVLQTRVHQLHLLNLYLVHRLLQVVMLSIDDLPVLFFNLSQR